MTDHDPNPSDAELRFRLRQLPRELEPARDLWPGIAARLPEPRTRTRPAWTVGLALAASLAVAVVGWRLVAPVASVAPVTTAANDAAPMPSGHIVQVEADAMTVEYQAALAEYRTLSVPAD